MLLPVMCDVTKDAEVRTLVGLASSTFHRPPSILVNCAGLAKQPSGLMDGSTAAWVDMLSTNVLATAMCCRCAWENQLLKKSHNVFITSGRCPLLEM